MRLKQNPRARGDRLSANTTSCECVRCIHSTCSDLSASVTVSHPQYGQTAPAFNTRCTFTSDPENLSDENNVRGSTWRS